MSMKKLTRDSSCKCETQNKGIFERCICMSIAIKELVADGYKAVINGLLLKPISNCISFYSHPFNL